MVDVRTFGESPEPCTDEEDLVPPPILACLEELWLEEDKSLVLIDDSRRVDELG